MPGERPDHEKHRACRRRQLTDLLTNYGEVSGVWFDASDWAEARWGLPIASGCGCGTAAGPVEVVLATVATHARTGNRGGFATRHTCCRRHFQPSAPSLHGALASHQIHDRIRLAVTRLPPRPGERDLLQTSVARRGVVPTHVGVNRAGHAEGWWGLSRPHARGGEPPIRPEPHLRRRGRHSLAIVPEPATVLLLALGGGCADPSQAAVGKQDLDIVVLQVPSCDPFTRSTLGAVEVCPDADARCHAFVPGIAGRDRLHLGPENTLVSPCK